MKKWIRNGIFYVILISHLLITGYPFIWMFISSFKTNKEYYGDPWGLPAEWQLENFVKAWNEGINDFLFNSTYITFFSVLGTLFVATLVSFYLARRPFKGSGWLLGFFLLAMLIPVQSTLIPLYVMITNLGLYDTFWALFFPYIGFGMPVAVFLIYGFFKQLPGEMEEAAMMDGCTIYGVFWRIFLPLSKPILATVTILSAFSIWNEFVFPLVMISSDSLKPLPLGLMKFRGNFSAEYGTMSASLVISTLPIIVLYLFLQKHITKGVAAGAVKG
ncbi:carbohydrate ABC transporter permease [Marinicrinis sediminis]|uniref:Carbohydrate ABC transporter permease n=1 Tax=Marinicrinis sediminis TaxID=1652465 RepID=A0ABW5RC78_9BACL